MNPTRELRLHRWALGGLAAPLGFLLLGGAAPRPPREVSLERLKDPREAQRIVLQAGPPGRTGMQLLDPAERPVWEERERKAP